MGKYVKKNSYEMQNPMWRRHDVVHFCFLFIFVKNIFSLRKAQWFSVSHLFFTTCFYLFEVEEKKGYVLMSNDSFVHNELN